MCYMEGTELPRKWILKLKREHSILKHRRAEGTNICWVHLRDIQGASLCHVLGDSFKVRSGVAEDLDDSNEKLPQGVTPAITRERE